MPAGPAEGGSGSGGSAEAELAAEVKLLREELAAAQEAAAAATGHAKQFELLARSSEDAFHSIQADHNKFKEEAHARCGGPWQQLLPRAIARLAQQAG
jgi:hypothetical protein